MTMTACGVSLRVTIFMAITALLLPRYYKWRDDRAFTLPVYDLEALGACEGYFQVNHSPATLHRLQKTTTDPNNIQPVGNAKLYYITTKCNTTESSNRDDNNNNNNDSSHNNKPHVVLLHGTGLSSKVFTDKPNPDSDDDSDDETLTLWRHLQDMDYDVTAIDMRGHGRSEITDGPYSIELLGADVAQLLRSMTTPPTTTAKTGNTNNKFHCYGFSAGFGACMSLAVYHTDIIASLSGSGFLMDRSQKDLMAYIFSREPVVRFLGTRVLSKMGKMVFKSPARYNALSTWMKHCHMDGYVHLSSSWLMFNITKDIPYDDWTIPTLYLLPEYDEDVGHTRELMEYELFELLPKGMGKLLYFPGYSHLMIGEEGGTAEIAINVKEFLSSISTS